METTDQKRCDKCIHYNKISRKMGYCETNVIEIFRSHLFNKNNKKLNFHITVKGSHYCGLHEEIKKDSI